MTDKKKRPGYMWDKNMAAFIQAGLDHPFFPLTIFSLFVLIPLVAAYYLLKDIKSFFEPKEEK